MSGANATDTIAALAADADPAPQMIIDVGCGRGTATVRLARQYPSAIILAVDQSPGLLTVVRDRLSAQHRSTALIAADFHHLPLPTASADLALAGFCLYHSPRPRHALAEIARCVRPGGWIIATTKSADSYHDIDALIATSGLDPGADQRPSLYQTFHTGNAEAVAAAAGLTVQRRVDQQHIFEFADLDHLAAYAITCPKYRLPANLTDATSLAAELRRRAPDAGPTTASTVTYLIAQRP
ncbi:class I SAM-dependent methyltransferase [Virgisporangium aurantiacum]|uniref:class I SAM-dependent methyltransferase n=1 Tax=Virgisporangium aurantiacum TaxID=175570 RepID=UPI00194FEAD1|nr:class I SAM-dependent methyltransferase [Virgisporangium aurantiacum]